VDLPAGECVLGVEFRRGAGANGRGATVTLLVDGEPCGSMEVPFAMFIMSSTGPSIGEDHGSQVSPLYNGPFPFQGTFHRLDVQLVSRADDAKARQRAEMARQ